MWLAVGGALLLATRLIHLDVMGATLSLRVDRWGWRRDVWYKKLHAVLVVSVRSCLVLLTSRVMSI